MSQLFDALQRSESEQSGTQFGPRPLVTEVIEAAERKAAKGEKTTECESAAAANAVTEPAEVRVSPPFGAELQDELVAKLSRQDADDEFDGFQSIQTSLPPQSKLVCLTDEDSLAAEKFRFLGVRLRQLRHSRPLKKVLITSAIPQEGKTMVAANLACTLARRAPQKTLLLEGDLRRPTLAQMFGLGGVPGMCEWLQEEGGPATSIYRMKGSGLWILPAGSAAGNPLELMQSKKLAAIMEYLSARFEWIVIDSPPVLPLGDTSLWMRLVDGILLVTRQGTTEKQQLKRGLEAIEPKKLIGALLNSAASTAHSDYYDHYRPTPVSQSPDDKSS